MGSDPADLGGEEGIKGRGIEAPSGEAAEVGGLNFESEPKGARPGGTHRTCDRAANFESLPRRLAPLGSDGTAHVIVCLKDQSLSVSAPHGRETIVDGHRITHILDPRTGHPAPAIPIAAAITDDPTVAEALSTALIVLGRRPSQLPSKYVTILPTDFTADTSIPERFNAV
jgi:hypothetical protein